MGDLIEALTILKKYADREFPTGCEHDILRVYDVGKDEPREAERIRLQEIGFHWDDDCECWASFRFGSA